MNKLLMLIGCTLTLSVWGQQVNDLPDQTDSTVEDEEIIGGIGGTGLRDMERPELLERPELDVDDYMDLDTDSALEHASDALEDAETSPP